MGFLLSVASVFLLIVSTTLASNNSSTQLNGWYPCNVFTFNQVNYSMIAECAIYNAPMCYAGVCETANSETLEVFVKRIQATSPSSTNVWLLQGGPGSSSVFSTCALFSRSLHVLLDNS